MFCYIYIYLDKKIIDDKDDNNNIATLIQRSLLQSSNKKLIFSDGFSDIAWWYNWTASSYHHIEIYSAPSLCYETVPGRREFHCVVISADNDGKETNIITNITNNYNSYQIEYDLTTWGGDINEKDYCVVSYSFDFIKWTPLEEVPNNSTVSIKIGHRSYSFNNTNSSQNILYIKLESIGNDNNDNCVYDNINLYGITTLRPTNNPTSSPTKNPSSNPTLSPTISTTNCRRGKTLIFSDGFSDIAWWYNWTASSYHHIEIYSAPSLCYETPLGSFEFHCVVISADNDGNETNIITNTNIANNYQIYTIEYDLTTWGGDSNDQDYCVVSYSFDFIKWIPLEQVPNIYLNSFKMGHRLYTFNNDNPSQNILYIKLESIGDDNNDNCVYDNINLYGYRC